ncbi:Solute carrier family 35 member C2 [Caligus rogercresseyi]|uniref:Solute carrier family 35 member C2 n=1 Tax=Caligus rogercresseyi TaxID=217165 RepID=A0A7T8QTU8_CALRO|nr:Solute carrier family 35 member C2 [Caligus rogercresseyi]
MDEASAQMDEHPFLLHLFWILHWFDTLSKKVYPYPLTIVLCHLIVKFLLAWSIRVLLGGRRTNVALDWRTYLEQLSIIGITSALDIGLSNWAIEFVTISLYTITKTTSIPFILLFALIFS